MEKQNNNLDAAKQDLEKWYDEEFLPYKESMEKQKKDFNNFKQIILDNPQKIKTMVASIFDNNFKELVKLWNELNFDPEIISANLNEYSLILNTVNNEVIKINLDDLLDKIQKILGDR